MDNTQFTLQEAGEDLLPALVALENACFSRPWSDRSFRAELESEDAVVLAAMRGEELLGFAVLHLFCDEGELFNLAVSAQERKRGVATKLLREILWRGEARGMKRTFLEVRSSNRGAIALYKAAGFDAVARRRKYYEDPVEDAVIMMRGGEGGRVLCTSSL